MLYRFWCVKYWAPGHPAAWGIGIALPLWGGCWAGSCVEIARSHGHLWKRWCSLSVPDEGWAVRVKSILGGCAGHALCLLAFADAKPLSAKPMQEKRVPRTWEGPGKALPRLNLTPMCPQDISMHLVKFQLRCLQRESSWGMGACGVKQAANQFDPRK